MDGFIKQLRQKKLFRVAGAYLVMAWLLIQVSNALEEAFSLPSWFDGVVSGVLILGFPVAVVSAWAFVVTPDGANGADATEKGAERLSLSWSDYSIAGLLLAVLAISGFQVATELGGTRGLQNVASLNAQPSIAVLPFADMSPASDNTYFAEGISEELLHALAQIDGLRVSARTSSFQFRDADMGIPEIAQRLGVATVLEGSIRKSGNRVRITVQLIEAETGYPLWSESYNRNLQDVFEIQEDIVREIARNLQLRLGVGAGTAIGDPRHVDPQAYEEYLRGLYLWGRRELDLEARYQARSAFMVSTELDPDFAEAWAALAMVNAGRFLEIIPLDERVAQTRVAIDRALDLDRDSARAHSAAAIWHSQWDIDLSKAGFHAGRAVEISPNLAEAHYAFAILEEMRADHAAADAAFERARALDPLNPTLLRNHANFLAHAGRFRKAISVLGECEATRCLQASSIHSSRITLAIMADREEALLFLLEANNPCDTPIPPVNEGPLYTFRMINIHIAFECEVSASQVDELARFFAGTTVGIWSAYGYARLDHDDEAFAILLEPTPVPRFFSAPETRDLMFSDGRFGFPEGFRRDSRFHEFWNQPGLAEMAEIRRANGVTAGLPLPGETAADR